MDYQQYRWARKLVYECCNYDNGNCIALDDGEKCICVQSISCSLLCKWFRIAVLLLDKPLETVLLFQKDMKRCTVCSQPFLTGSNRAKYCKPCAAKVHRKQKNASKTDTEIPAYLPLSRFWVPLDLSNDAKILYALLFDRAGISKENGYIEPDGTIRLYFTLEEAKKNCTGAVRLQPALFRNWSVMV